MWKRGRPRRKREQKKGNVTGKANHKAAEKIARKSKVAGEKD